MTQERMAYFAQKYLEERISFWEDYIHGNPADDMAYDALTDYKNELQALKDLQLLGSLTEEGHW